MTPATAAAVSLLERLRTLAETWEGVSPPSLGELRERAGLSGVLSEVEEFTAMRALLVAGYYPHATKIGWLTAIDAAIAALKGETK